MDTRPFIAWMRRRGLSPRTAQLYARTVSKADDRARDLGTTVAEIDIPLLDDVVNLWPRSASSRAQVRCALRQYWIFVRRPDPPDSAIRVPKKDRMHCRALDEVGAMRLSRAARGPGAGLPGLAVLLGLYGALRRSEIATLRWEEIDLGAGRLTVVGKGDQTRSFPINPTLLDALRRAPRSSPWVFPGAGGAGHANPATIWDYVRRVAAKAQMPRVRPHELRHTALATALDRTRDLRAVMTFAGHVRPETTAGYTRTTSKRLAAVVEAIDYEAAVREAWG